MLDFSETLLIVAAVIFVAVVLSASAHLAVITRRRYGKKSPRYEVLREGGSTRYEVLAESEEETQ